jgi:superfamily II DNA or RNA helicase
MDTVWSSKGYRVLRTPELLQKVKKELTIYSEAPQEVPGPKTKVVCFRHDNDYIYVPYYYGEKNWGKPKKRFKQEDNTINLTFQGGLRPYQENIIEKTMEHFDDVTRGGILALSTGVGKTCLALYLIPKLGLKTLIVVHKQILLDQWVDRIHQFLPGAKIGIIQGPKAEIDNMDIVIGMVQTMTQREYGRDYFKSIGFLILDEVHNMCSRTFNEVFFKIQTKYRIGLSATPKRKDGFDKVLAHHLGPIIFEMHLTIVEPFISVYHLEPNDQVEMSLTRFGKTNLPALVTDLSANDIRNAIITKILLQKITEGRKILVLSDRVLQCERLHEFFMKNCKSGHWSDVFTGKRKREQLEKAMGADIIFATYGIFKEGVDCPLLDTLLFATPKTDIVQACGRILRQKNIQAPEVIDIVDTIGPLKNQWYKRCRWYKGKNYKIDHYDQEMVNLEPKKESTPLSVGSKLIIRNDDE